MITFDRVGRRYGDVVAVRELSLQVDSGEIVVLLGPSGCGKTTTLKMVNRLVEPSSGTVLIDGRDTRQMDGNRLRRSIGYVIQQVGLFPHQTVAENVATVPRLLGWDRTRTAGRVEELLELVGLPPAQYARRLPSELSGGESQRVGVARALGADPEILLMDEPFGAIDPLIRGRLQGELLRLQELLHKTIVFVTHDLDEAVRLGDRIALLSRGGVLEQYATPDQLLAAPANAFAAEFLGDGRMVRRLALRTVGSARLSEVNGAGLPATSIGAQASLRDALDAVLSAKDGRVAVRDEDRFLGVIDAEAIREAGRSESVREVGRSESVREAGRSESVHEARR